VATHQIGECAAVKNILQVWLKLTTVAVVVGAFTYGSGFAAEKKKADPQGPACNSLKAETDCMPREDCSWIAASVDTKTQKVKRKAYCRAKPKPKPKTKAKAPATPQ
jgi:hypothetical protein